MGDTEFKCHNCGDEAVISEKAAENFELPTNWGFIFDDDPFQPSGKGAYYACPECKCQD